MIDIDKIQIKYSIMENKSICVRDLSELKDPVQICSYHFMQGNKCLHTIRISLWSWRFKGTLISLRWATEWHDPEPLQIQPHRRLCFVCLQTLQAVQTSYRSLGVSICMKRSCLDCPSLPHAWCNECQWFCLTVIKQSRTVMSRTYFAHQNCKTGRMDCFKVSKIQ